MAPSNIKILSWNCWFESQNGKRFEPGTITTELESVLEKHKPDFIFLFEVYFDKNGRSELVEYFNKNGYFTHFSDVITTKKKERIGNLFATKQKFEYVESVTLVSSSKPHVNWYSGYKPNLIEVEIEVNGTSVKIIGLHLCVLLPKDWIVHLRHRMALNKYIKSLNKENLIIVGDFNELKIISRLLNMGLNLRQRTGNFIRPTAIWNGKRRNIIWFNADYVMWTRHSKLKNTNFKVINSQKSDHALLLSEFTMR